MTVTGPTIDRRTLLIGGGAGIGLLVAFFAWPRGGGGELPARPGEQAFNAFVKIGRDGRVTVAVPQVETGQGIWTALPQLAAHELGAAWENVAVEPAPIGGGYGNALAAEWLRALDLDAEASRVTAGSTSTRAFEQSFRDAGATARAMLIAAAARRWDVDAVECDTADGFVTNGARRLTFGELAEEAASLSPASVPRRRSRGERALAGKPLPRLDLPAKSDGSFRFAADVRLPDMLFASARLGPPGGRLAGHAHSAARAVPGVRAILSGEDWIAAAGDTWWAAERAMRVADARFQAAPAGNAGARERLEAALEVGSAELLFSRGDYDSAIQGSRPLGATYYAAPAMHLGLEPLTATARVSGGRVEVWAPTQAPEFARAKAKEAADGAEVTLYPMPAGDSGGRALEADAIGLAVRLARGLERPVQLTLSQAASQMHDRPGPAALARMYALPGQGGLTAAWRMRLASADGLGAALRRLAGEQPAPGLALLDPPAPPYAIPNMRIDGVAADLPYTPGYMRGEPHRTLTFFTESFVDELARLAGSEPLAFRMAMLGGNPRLAQCLAAAAAAGGWDGGGAGSAKGIAACSAFGSNIGLLAEASIGPGQRIKVHRLTAAVDCGRIANPQLVRQQIEGGLIWALGTASAPEPEFAGGLALARPLGAHGLPRIGDTPEIHVQLMPSGEAPGGVSGLGAAVLAPAVANAIFAATGKRMRSLPFDPMAAE